MGKNKRFEKVVLDDSLELFNIIYWGGASILFPLLLLLSPTHSFSHIVVVAFIDAVFFMLFVDGVKNYIKSRKVYWEEIK